MSEASKPDTPALDKSGPDKAVSDASTSDSSPLRREATNKEALLEALEDLTDGGEGVDATEANGEEGTESG